MNNLDKIEIHNIFQNIKLGRKEAIEELYTKYQKLVINIAFSIVKDKNIAEEISQMVFEKILQMPNTNIPNNNELSWLYSVTKHQTIDYLRKQRNTVDIDEIYDIKETDDSVNEIIDRNTYKKMIEGLDTIDKEIVSLKVLSNFTFKEIGIILGMPTGTVQWRYYKAVHALKMLLSNVSMFIISIVVTAVIYINKNQPKPNVPGNRGNIPDAAQSVSSIDTPQIELIRVLIWIAIPIVFLILTIIFAKIFIKRQQKREVKSSK